MAWLARTTTSAVLFFSLIGLATAQAPTGSIAGVIRDPSGATVPEAHVTAVSTTTALARTTAASEQGNFSFLALPAGGYQVSSTAPGFQSTVRQAVVEAGATTMADLT